jgi:hypothetical protein
MSIFLSSCVVVRQSTGFDADEVHAEVAQALADRLGVAAGDAEERCRQQTG